jgi:lipopolysaccharide/colanic/teichoic acid biosynthesis glycosyltransferase
MAVYNREHELKRIFDISLAVTGLLFSAWLWVLICIFIIIDDGTPIFVKQMRVGKNGRLFTLWKFRSMKKSSHGARLNRQAQENDTRATRLGRIFRKTALDELPQLINILFNDMSFVGPRPVLFQEKELNGSHETVEQIPGYRERISIRPGLTGFAQIYASRNLPRKLKFKYDILYVRKNNFLLDLKLLLISILVTLTGNWEKSSRKLGLVKGKTKNTDENPL